VLLRVKHVHRVRVGGRLYYYHRVTGEKLPADEAARAQRVVEINATLDRPPPPADTIAALIASFKASADYEALAPQTRKDYDRHLAGIEAVLGRFAPAVIRRRHVLELKDTLLKSLGARQANYRLSVLSRLFSFAVDRELRPDNPAARVKRFKEGGGYKAWPLEAVQAALTAAYPELRHAILFMLCTGLRPSDAAAAAWTNVADGWLTITQRKTGADVQIPVGASLGALLAELPRRATTILSTRTGRAWRQNWLSREVAALIQGLGYRELVPHGLRETAATLLAGEGDATIQALLGQASHASAARYRRHAAKRTLATKAVARIDEALAGQQAVKPSG
jgi:integrase